MARYRARHCPQCSYFIGFAVAKPSARFEEVRITNFCLNCNYRFPVHSIVEGTRKTASVWRRSGLRLVHSVPKMSSCRAATGETRKADMESKITPSDYSRHLRAIGQDLETLRFNDFNLELTGDAYLVWVKSSGKRDVDKPLSRISKTRLQKLWRNRTTGREEPSYFASSEDGRRLRYTVPELDRMEREQRARRRMPSGNADGHSLSQLLRTLGDFIGQRSERLLGIAWQELSVGVVFQTHQGRKEIEVFRPDNLYDLWVRMYLKRNHRALFDTPR